MPLPLIHHIPGKIQFWLKVYFLGLIQFALFRSAFLFIYFGDAGEFTIGQLLHSYYIGLRFDTVVLSIVILPLFVVNIIPGVELYRKPVRIIYSTLLYLIFTVIIFLNAADLGFFRQFGSRLNYWAVEYLDNLGLMFYSIATYPVTWIYFIVFLVLAAIMIFILRLVIKAHSARPRRINILFRYGAYLALIVLLVIGIRGRFGIKPLDWGEAFFSENQFINQLTLNGVYTLSHSIYEESEGSGVYSMARTDRFDNFKPRESVETIREMLNIDSLKFNDSLSLARTSSGKNSRAFLPNIVIVLMESWSAERIGIYGDTLGITPCFDSLAGQGMLFRNFYANGVRTSRGIAATLCSFPSLSGRSILKRYSASYPFMSIAQVLHPFGYTSAFVYGGDMQFDNMKGFLRNVGFEEFYDENSFGDAPRLGKWGVRDDVMFEQMAAKMDSLPRPFLTAILTISFHDPFQIPDERFAKIDESFPESARRNCLYFSDWAMGRFIDSVGKYSYFDSTLFVFLADHCDLQSTRYVMSPEHFKIPLLFYSPALLGDSAVTIEETGSQVDVIPTLLDFLDLSAEHQSWGKSIFDTSNGDDFAVVVNSDKQGLLRNGLFYFDWGGMSAALHDMNDPNGLDHDIKDRYPDIVLRMRRDLAAYLQTAEYLSTGVMRQRKSGNTP